MFDIVAGNETNLKDVVILIAKLWDGVSASGLNATDIGVTEKRISIVYNSPIPEAKRSWTSSTFSRTFLLASFGCQRSLRVWWSPVEYDCYSNQGPGFAHLG